MAISRNTKIGILLTTTILFVSVVFYGYQLFFASNFLVQQDKPQYLYIPKGANFNQVKDSLEKNHLIHDFLPFAFVSKFLGYQEKVKPGAFEIQPNEANWTVIKRLRAGRQTPIRLTFNTIRTKKQLAERLGNKLEFSEQDLLNLLENPDIQAKYQLDAANIISLFIPDTYELYWTISPKSLLEKMDKAYKKFWNEERLAKAAKLKLSPAQIMAIASIVQAETNKVDEMPRVAGVYLNRLAINMPLQADPTVVFAVGDFEIKRVREGHKKVDSPYNTYKYNGLPPGPIAIPSQQSVDAVLNKETHDFLFFCAREDFSGYHNFTKDFDAHLKNARIYQKALNKAGIL
jgi:UPF0755 protein